MLIESLSPEAFAPYGRVLERDPQGEAFQPLFTDTSASCGWRVAILQVEPGPIQRVHRHSDSEECFSPLRGSPCIAVASPESPEQIRTFHLDHPIVMHRQVWHEVFSADGDPAQVFIAENAVISGEEHRLQPPLSCP
jgi:ureidoglycolate hydrolase